MSARRAIARVVAAVALLLAGTTAGRAEQADRIVVGSKNFPESRLLGEIFAQLLAARTDLGVERRLGLAGTQVCFEALRSGAIDVYPEYTGTGLVAILGESPRRDARETLLEVRRAFRASWNLAWLAPLGFENSYEIAVREELARRHGLATISDLAPLAPHLAAGFGYEFVRRPDGLPGLEKAYGLRFREVEPMQQALKYRAAGAGRIDVLDVYTTDGRLLTYHLRVLTDDRRFFPPYQAAPLVRGATLERHPEVGSTLALLAGAFDASSMRTLNRRLQEEGEPVSTVARDALVTRGLLPPGGTGRARHAPVRTGLFGTLWRDRAALAHRTAEHLAMSAAALLLGILVAVPLGLALERWRSGAEAVIRAVGLTQTIPSIALLAFMIPWLGVGFVPAIVALWIYSLFPILRNTYTGLEQAGPDAVDAARALGMSERQILARIRFPLAMPIILAGVRTAAVLTIGTATLAAFIGAGGLGEPIVSGLQLADTTLVLSGALPAAVLALVVDAALALVTRALAPRGVGEHRRHLDADGRRRAA